jgi:hypothetical protein
MTPATWVACDDCHPLSSSGQRGIAMIMAVLCTAFLSALGIGLMLAVFMDRLASGNLAGSVAMLYAADAGIELAARDVAMAEDWNQVLSGTSPSAFIDGAASGVRAVPGGGAVDLTTATNLLNCGRTTTCTVAQMNANSRERPWGANNPRWQLYAYGPMNALADLARPAPCYLIVWLADDPRELDGNPLEDAASGFEPGHGIVRVRAEVYGPGGTRRAVEAELARVCLPGGCLPGIRVQSWQEVRQAVP